MNNISISNISVLRSGGDDFFNINSECSVENCSILVLVFVIIMGTLISVALFIIIRRIRSRNSRIYVQVRAVKVKNIEKEFQNMQNNEMKLEISDFSMSNAVNTSLTAENQKAFQFKILTEDSNRQRSSAKTLSTAKHKESDPKENNGTNEINQKVYMNKNESGSSKSSKKNYFNEKLENKSQMFGDDSSIQYEDDSFHNNNNEIIQQNEGIENFEEKKEITCSVQAFLQNSNVEREKIIENEEQELRKNESGGFQDIRLKTILEENEGNNESLRNPTLEKSLF